MVKLWTCLFPPNCVSRTLKPLHVHAHFCSLELCVVGFLAYSHSPIVCCPVRFTVRGSSVNLPWRYYSDEFLRYWCCRAILILIPRCRPLHLMCLWILATDILVWRWLARLLEVFVSCIDYVPLRSISGELCGGIRITDVFVLARERNNKLHSA